MDRNLRKTRVGMATSDKMDKTGAVSVKPYPSTRFTPTVQKKLSIAGGKAPPPETPTLKAFPSFARILLKTSLLPKAFNGDNINQGRKNKIQVKTIWSFPNLACFRNIFLSILECKTPTPTKNWKRA